MWQNARQGVQLVMQGQNKSYQNAGLNPRYVYLEVHTPQNSALLTLALEDQPQNREHAPPIDTWVSTDGKIVRTQAGFLSSAQGVAHFWQNTAYLFNSQGQPTSVSFDVPSSKLYGLRMHLQPLGPIKGDATPLMRRAAKLPSIEFTAWQGRLINGASSQSADSKFKSLNFIIGVDTKTRVPLYGYQCLRANYCVEYLLRTAKQNL